MKNNHHLKKETKPTTGADIFQYLSTLTLEELEQLPIITLANGEIFDQNHTILVNKKVKINIVIREGKESLLIGNFSEDFHNHHGYTLKQI